MQLTVVRTGGLWIRHRRRDGRPEIRDGRGRRKMFRFVLSLQAPGAVDDAVWLLLHTSTSN